MGSEMCIRDRTNVTELALIPEYLFLVANGHIYCDPGVGAVSYTHLTLPTTPYV